MEKPSNDEDKMLLRHVGPCLGGEYTRAWKVVWKTWTMTGCLQTVIASQGHSTSAATPRPATISPDLPPASDRWL